MRQLIKNADIFDGTHEALIKNAGIVINDGLIEEISQTHIAEDNFERVIDATGLTAIPGLCDMHMHLFFTTSGAQMDTLTLEEICVRSTRFAREVLERGFTTVRDACGCVFGLKTNIDNGFLPGPRIFPSYACISQTCGHGDFRTNRAQVRTALGEHTSPFMRSGAHVLADGVDEVLKAARNNLFMGASQIKIQAGGGMMSGADPLLSTQYTFDEIKAAVGCARAYGTYVMAHIYTPQAMQQAARAGVLSFEHATLLDDETARMVKDMGIWLCPGPQQPPPGQKSDSPSTSKFGFPVDLASKRELFARGQQIQTELINKYDLNIVYGTDAIRDPNNRIPQNQLLDFKAFKRRFGSFRGLRAATGEAGRLLSMSTYMNPYPDGKIGLIEPGAFADLLLVKGNPVEDLEILSEADNVRMIMKNGEVYKDCLTLISG